MLYLADGGRFLGSIIISDTVRSDVPDALRGLRAQGVRSLVMLTGDKEAVGKAVGERLGLDKVFGGLLPGDKVQKVEELLREKPSDKTLAFVGGRDQRCSGSGKGRRGDRHGRYRVRRGGGGCGCGYYER